jgi:hypothetical protein
MLPEGFFSLLYLIRTFMSRFSWLFSFGPCCTTHTQHKYPYPRRDSNSRAERPQTYALDFTAMGIGLIFFFCRQCGQDYRLTPIARKSPGLKHHISKSIRRSCKGKSERDVEISQKEWSGWRFGRLTLILVHTERDAWICPTADPYAIVVTQSPGMWRAHAELNRMTAIWAVVVTKGSFLERLRTNCWG